MYRILFSNDAKKDLKELSKKAPQAIKKLSKILEEIQEHPRTGTGQVVYTLMPIICDIALKKGIRPERPCAVASIASQVGITYSPIAAAVASFVVISSANGFEVTNLQVVAVTIPSC